MTAPSLTNTAEVTVPLTDQIPQTEGAARVITVGAVGEVGGKMATGAIPKPSNPYYIPRVDNPERILSSTPPGQAGYQVFGPTVPNLSPINLRTPPGM